VLAHADGKGQKDEEGRDGLAQDTLRPTRSPPPMKATATPARASGPSRGASKSFVDDYSDMAFDEDEPGLEAKMAGLKVRRYRIVS
jgi:hypothetical protein